MAPSPAERERDEGCVHEENISNMETDNKKESLLCANSSCRRRSTKTVEAAENKSCETVSENFDNEYTSDCKECLEKQFCCQNQNLKVSESSTDSCKKCQQLKENNFPRMEIYHKKKEDSIVRNASIRAAVFKWSPAWFKSLVRDPEYIMSNVKSKFSSE